MSINHLIDENQTPKLDVYANNIQAKKVSVEEEFDELKFKCQNDDVVNLSSLVDKGIGGYRLTSDGDGSVSWTEGAGSSGVDYNGNDPVAIGKLAIYGATNGKLIKDSNLSDTDILNKNGDTMNGNLDMNNQNIQNTTTMDINTINTNANIDPNNINIISRSVNFNTEFINCNGQPSAEIEWRFTRQGVNYGNFGTENGVFFFGNFNNPLVNTEIRGANNEKLVIDDSTITPECRLENLNLNLNNSDIENVSNIDAVSLDGIQLISGTNAQDLLLNNANFNIKIPNCNLDMDNNNIDNISIIDTAIINTNTLTSSLPKIDVIANFDMNNGNILNANDVYIDRLYSTLPATEIQVENNLRMRNNDIVDVNTIDVNTTITTPNINTDTIQTSTSGKVLFNNDIDLFNNDILSSGNIKTTSLSSTDIKQQNIDVNANFDMNNNDIDNINNLQTTNTDTTTLTIATTTKYISNVSQLPTASGGFHLLEDNTSYIICGQITLINGIQFGNNCSLSGVDFSASITFDETLNDIIGFKSVDTNVYLSKLNIIGGGGRFSGVPSFTTGLFNCDDFDVVGGFPFYGRNRRFKVEGCNFIAVYSLGRVRGYATLNFNNNLISGTDAFDTYEGLEVIDGLSLEFLGNKIVLFRGGADPTNPAKLLRLGNSIVIPVIPQKLDGLMGFNAVNISSNIFHPRGNFENGVDFGITSKTELGVISGNTFIRSGGTAPLINYLLADTFDNYATTGIVNYDIEANAGVVNSSPLLKSIVGQGTQITNPVNYTDLPFPISNIKALEQCKRFGLEITLTGVSGTGYTKGNFLESTTGGLERYCIADVDDIIGTTQTIVITDMSDPIPDVLGSRELDKDFVATGIINTGIQNTLGDITPIYRYFDKDPRQLILQTSLSYQNDSKDETVEFRPVMDMGAGYINDDDCSVITTAVKQNQLQTITITCAILCNTGTKIKFQVKQVPPDATDITIGKMVNTMK